MSARPRRRVPYWGWGAAITALVWNPLMLWHEWTTGIDRKSVV